jgi:hypothetical protein
VKAAQGHAPNSGWRETEGHGDQPRKGQTHAQEKRRPFAIGFVGSRRLRGSRVGDFERRSSSRNAIDHYGSENRANTREVDFDD